PREIKRQRLYKPARPDAQNACRSYPPLAVRVHSRQDELARVAGKVAGRQRDRGEPLLVDNAHAATIAREPNRFPQFVCPRTVSAISETPENAPQFSGGNRLRRSLSRSPSIAPS